MSRQAPQQPRAVLRAQRRPPRGSALLHGNSTASAVPGTSPASRSAPAPAGRPAEGRRRAFQPAIAQQRGQMDEAPKEGHGDRQRLRLPAPRPHPAGPATPRYAATTANAPNTTTAAATVTPDRYTRRSHEVRSAWPAGPERRARTCCDHMCPHQAGAPTRTKAAARQNRSTTTPASAALPAADGGDRGEQEL